MSLNSFKFIDYHIAFTMMLNTKILNYFSDYLYYLHSILLVYNGNAFTISSNLDQRYFAAKSTCLFWKKESVLLFSGIGLRYNFSCHRKYYVEPFIYNMEHTYMDMVHYMIGWNWCVYNITVDDTTMKNKHKCRKLPVLPPTFTVSRYFHIIQSFSKKDLYILAYLYAC